MYECLYSLSKPHTSVTALHMCAVLQLSHENESEGRLLDGGIDVSDTRNDDG